MDECEKRDCPMARHPEIEAEWLQEIDRLTEIYESLGIAEMVAIVAEETVALRRSIRNRQAA